MIRVVSGVAREGRLVLMGKRKAGGLRPGLWELPGGKVDDGETPEHALAREWHEELGVLVRAGRRIAQPFRFDLERAFEIELFEVLEDAPRSLLRALPLDHEELRWVSLEHAVQHLPCSPGFYVHYPELRGWMEANR